MPNPSDKDWNKEFQDLLELPDIEEKFTKIRHLAQDFISIGKIQPPRRFSKIHIFSHKLCQDYYIGVIFEKEDYKAFRNRRNCRWR